MHRRSIGRLAAMMALGLSAAAFGPTGAQAYEGPTWSTGETVVSESTAVHSKSSVATFEDSKAATKVECRVITEGKVNSLGKDEVTAFVVSECLNVKGCTGTITVLALHLPWHTQLEEVEGKFRDIVSSGGSGQPGWSVECTVLGIKVKDECTGETTTGAEDNAAGVNLAYDSKSAHESCSIGGAGTGISTGTELDEAAKLLQVGGPVIALVGATILGPATVVLFPGGAAQTVVFENLSGLQQIWLNGVQDRPGVFTENELTNFSTFAVGANPCGLAVLPRSTCEMNITSAAAGRKGAYEVLYGAGSTINFLLES